MRDVPDGYGMSLALGLAEALQLLDVRFELTDLFPKMFDVRPVFRLAAPLGVEPFVLAPQRGDLVLQCLVFGVDGRDGIIGRLLSGHGRRKSRPRTARSSTTRAGTGSIGARAEAR